MKKIKITKLLAILTLSVGLIGCSTEKTTEDKSTQKEAMTFEQIAEDSKGKTVNIHMWGGDKLVNNYIDNFVSPKAKEQLDITVNRVPVNDPRDSINKLLTEKQAGKDKGSVDILWMNGENFKISKDNKLLHEPFADQLPNYNQFVNKNATDIKYDFGEDTEGLEVPWGKSQFVMVYDSDKIQNPPKDMKQLKSWISEHPGRFTYPAPPDFTGSAFVRHAFYYQTESYDKYLEGGKIDSLREDTEPVWAYLNDIKKDLWRNGETYPESSIKLDQLYSSGEVDMTMSYNPIHALNKIKDGQFKDTTKTFIFEQGTISNTHYLTIPFNSQNDGAAMTLINYMISPEAQIAKYDPKYWGDGIALDLEKLDKLDKENIDKIDLGDSVLPLETIADKRIPEILAQYVEKIEEYWTENVAK